jgi:hypothetical protein
MIKYNLLNITSLVFGLILSFFAPIVIDAQGYYNRYEYRRKRHEINFGGGATNCLTDLGGADVIGSGFLWDLDIAKSSYVGQVSYVYWVASKFALRGNLAYSKVSGDDAQTQEYYRNNRNLNFETNLIEGSVMCEVILRNVRTGNRYNLKTPAGKFIGARNPLGIGFYLLAGIGGIYYQPWGKDNFDYSGTGLKYQLNPLNTEGQGQPDPITGEIIKDYSGLAICIPMGFGIKKAFNGNGGIKLEAAYRFTNTDYIDDVSTVYYKYNNNSTSSIMSGTESGKSFSYTGYTYDGSPLPEGATYTGNPNIPSEYTMTLLHTSEGYQRGNPDNDDSYMYVTLSAYKKFNNSAKAYRTINMHQKRKIKASF